MTIFINLIILLFSLGFLLLSDTKENKNNQVKLSIIDSLGFIHQIDNILQICHLDDPFNISSNLKKTRKKIISKSSTINEINGEIIPSYNDSVIRSRMDRIPKIIPLEYNPKLRNYVKNYTISCRRQMSTILARSSYYFPVIEEILDKYQLPYELKYLTVVESALNPKATSIAGATGLWQFMSFTGDDYKLKQNSIVDERRDVVKSTHAAAKYLKMLHKRYDNWLLALAAYNCGHVRVDRAVRITKTKNYWVVRKYLPKETQHYVPAFIAAVYSMNYHKEHNIFSHKAIINENCDTVILKKPVNLYKVAQGLQISYKTLKLLNPKYKSNYIPAYNNKYEITLPASKCSDFIVMTQIDKNKLAEKQSTLQLADN